MQSETKRISIDKLFVNVCHKLKNFDKELNENFIKLKTNFDRFKFIWSIGLIHHEFDLLLAGKAMGRDEKNSNKSSENRQLGNGQFKAKRFFDALNYYNTSIRYAPKHTNVNDENDLALSYANRSAVYFHLNKFKMCLKDIESSFYYGYPHKLRIKLIERKLNCLIRLQLYQEALHVLKIESNESLNNNFVAKINLAQSAKNTPNSDTDQNTSVYFKKYGQINFEIDASAPSMPNASDSVSLDYSIERGFHIRAKRDIQPGELIVNEKPFAAVLNEEYFLTNCFECLIPVNCLYMNLTYCTECSSIVYCSTECANKAWDSHHKYECKHLNLLSSQLGITNMEWLSLRIVLKASLEYLISIKQELEYYEKKYETIVRDESALFALENGEAKVINSNQYSLIFPLITNSSVRKLSDLFRRSFVAMFLVKYLINADFFEIDKSSPILAEQACFIGGLILRHLQSISCNAHEISELKLDESKKKPMADSYAQGIGAGIFAILSMFNHSCDPDVTRNFRGSKCQVRSLRTIKKGDEILDNYGVIYAVNELDQRKAKLLEQYFFDCNCMACTKRWPLYDKLLFELNTDIIKCSECRSKKSSLKDCDKCLQKLDEIKLYQHNSQQSLRNLLAYTKDYSLDEESTIRKISEGFTNFCTYIKQLELNRVKRPYQDFNNNEEAIKQCLNLINLKNKI